MSDTSHRDRCAIVGVGASDFSRASGRTTLSLAAAAAQNAIADAGLEVDKIDGLVRCESDAVSPNDLANALGLAEVSYWGSAGTGGAAPCAMVGQAVGAILSGQARNVLLYRALNGRSGRRFGQGAQPGTVGGDGALDEFFVPHGLVTPGQAWSLIAQRHMHEFGTRREDLAHIALACRARANANPAAQMHGRAMTMDGYLGAPMISSPLGLYDYCLETDGACAVVVTSAERANAGPHPQVLIRAVSQGMPAGVQGGMFMSSLMRDTLTTQPSALTAERLYARAGMTPADMEVAQLYDCFTITVLMQLEDYGFCAKGEGGAFAASGALEPGGQLPINTAGGNLSEGYIHGMNHVVEGVRQLRGESSSPIRDASTCLVTSGIPVATSAMILRRAA